MLKSTEQKELGRPLSVEELMLIAGGHASSHGEICDEQPTDSGCVDPFNP